MKPMSQRQHRMCEVVRQVVAQTLVDGSVPLPGDTSRLTLSDLWISADLRIARCYMAGLGEQKSETLQYLNASHKSFRKILSKRMENKYIPTLEFYEDKDGEQALRVFSALREQEDKEPSLS